MSGGRTTSCKLTLWQDGFTTPTMLLRRSVFSVEGTASVFLLEADSITGVSAHSEYRSIRWKAR
jgi:hypothetical protein